MPEAAVLSSVAAICCGANRTCHCISWGRNGLLCFASSRAVAVCDPSDNVNSVIATLTGHEDQVTCVRWISTVQASGGGCLEQELVSGSVDKSVIVWSRAVGSSQYTATARLLGHTAPISSVAAHTISIGDAQSSSPDAVTLVASASGDSTVRLWLRQHSRGSAFTSHQALPLGSGFALDVVLGCHSALALPLVACGCEDTKIHLFATSCSVLDACSGSGSFSHVYSLVGHEDWVRGLSFASENSGDLLLASCSQDTFIRVWRIARQDSCSAVAGAKAAHGSGAAPTERSHDDLLKPRLQLFDVSFTGSATAIRFAVSVETVLAGHDGWVYGVHWQPGNWLAEAEVNVRGGGGSSSSGSSNGGGTWMQPLRLLSASMDRTMIVWEPEQESGLWMEQMRVGDVGGNTLGLYGCQFSPCGRSIIAHGYQGGFIRWNLDIGSGTWKAGTTVGGHFGAVQDLAWDPVGGEYLLSVSLDQTSRLFAPWLRHQVEFGEHAPQLLQQRQQPPRWYEMARPQVHGYDVQCLALLGRYRFASGADEKVVRVFEAPSNFLDNFSRLCGHDRGVLIRQRDAESVTTGSAVPEGASVPALGLSNKAVYQGKPAPDLYAERDLVPHEDEQYAEHSFRPLELTAPPTEDNLVQNTLWPEIQKLYGHGFEIFTLAASPDGKLLASACKATKGEYASILVWDTATWKPLFTLDGHSLTVSQMAFCHGGTRLLSVSRDRTWCVHEVVVNGSVKTMRKVAATDKHTALHSRIIWSCAWSHDDRCFATASRDKRIILWLHKQSSTEDDSMPYQSHLDVPEFADAVTAVDFAPFLVAGGTRYLIAAGLESGHIALFTWMSGAGYQHCAEFGKSLAHHLAVRRLAFRNCSGRAGVRSCAVACDNSGTNTTDERSLLQLASCSDDRAVKVYDLRIAL